MVWVKIDPQPTPCGILRHEVMTLSILLRDEISVGDIKGSNMKDHARRRAPDLGIHNDERTLIRALL
jgi:hypothetical protein